MTYIYIYIYNLKFKDTCHGLQDLYSIACSRIHIWNTLDRTLPWRSFRLTHHRSIWPNKTEICVGNRYQLTQLNPGSVVQSQPRLHLKLQIEGASPESLSKLSRANPRVKMFLSKHTNVLYVSNHSNCFGTRNCLAQCEFTDTQSEIMFRNLSLPSNLHLSYIIY